VVKVKKMKSVAAEARRSDEAAFSMSNIGHDQPEEVIEITEDMILEMSYETRESSERGAPPPSLEST
jgi:DNA-directed RNA polymerase alpha subunit